LTSTNKNLGIPQHVLSTGRVTAVLATAHFTQVRIDLRGSRDGTYLQDICIDTPPNRLICQGLHTHLSCHFEIPSGFM
jgi:hypothetical protein